MATYTKHSPYYATGSFGPFLDIMEQRAIPKSDSDAIFKITVTYLYRPDLLAYDLYGNAGLWWVFASRNPDILIDPIFDFYVGQSIYIPKKDALIQSLGI
jgi:hypothetical protein